MPVCWAGLPTASSAALLEVLLLVPGKQQQALDSTPRPGKNSPQPKTGRSWCMCTPAPALLGGITPRHAPHTISQRAHRGEAPVAHRGHLLDKSFMAPSLPCVYFCSGVPGITPPPPKKLLAFKSFCQSPVLAGPKPRQLLLEIPEALGL